MNKKAISNQNSALRIVFFTVFIDLLGFGIAIPVLPSFSLSFGAEAGIMSSNMPAFIAAAVFSFMQFISAPFWGAKSDQIGRRPVFLISIAISFVAYLLFGAAHSLIVLYLSRLLAGIGAGNFSAAQAYIADITPPEKRAQRYGLIGVAFGLGFIIGPFVGGALKNQFGFESIGYFCAALCAINFLYVYFMLPESNTNPSRTKTKALLIITNLFKIAQRPKLMPIFLLYFAFIMAFSMMQVSSTVLWEKVYLLDTLQIGFIFSYIGICSALVQGLFIKKFKKLLGERKMLLFGTVLMAIAITGIPFAPFDKVTFILVELSLLLLIAIANGLIMPASSSLVSSLSTSDEQGKVLGSMQSFGSLARGLGPFIAGGLYDFDPSFPFLAGGFILLLCFSWVHLKIKTT